MRITLRILPYVFIQFLIIILVGVGELLAMDWGFEKLVTAEFWFSYLTLTLASIMSFFSWANLRIDVISGTPYHKGMELDNKIDLNDLGVTVAIKRNSLNTLVLKYRTSDLPDFLKEINLIEKRKRYISYITNKLNRIRSRHNPNITKIKYLEDTITEDWLNKNLEHINVKYTPVTEAYIINGILDKHSNTFRQRSLYRGEKMVMDNIHKWILSLAYTLLVTSITFSVSVDYSLAVIYTILIKVGSCILLSFITK